jgi:hypothetical protein
MGLNRHLKESLVDEWVFENRINIPQNETNFPIPISFRLVMCDQTLQSAGLIMNGLDHSLFLGSEKRGSNITYQTVKKFCFDPPDDRVRLKREVINVPSDSSWLGANRGFGDSHRRRFP